MAVGCFQQNLILEHYLSSVVKASDKVIGDLYKMSVSMTKNVDEEKKDLVRKRILGELVVENRELFLEKLSSKEKKLLDKYDIQVLKNPNHPYKLPGNKMEIIKDVTWREIKKAV